MTIEISPCSEERVEPLDPSDGVGGRADGGVRATGDDSGVLGAAHAEVLPGAVFTAVVTGGLEQWRVVAVLGIRVLAERLEGSERRSFTLRFVRYRLALPADEQEPRQRRAGRRSA
ncbi:hypothetical protein NB037_17140 [Rathayibacter sp. ZW T2_19]|uniref:Uncharacterized protein n=1 Tax=Rathayibacter rubneri TaxID=2950106 RepID=A0A9X2IUJ1_9MICO|nr:hypothetical protein [Rathayibacter rubneri]MCM6764142.1 hypothetical protein [Rathayibacter rubneri]